MGLETEEAMLLKAEVREAAAGTELQRDNARIRCTLRAEINSQCSTQIVNARQALVINKGIPGS